MSDLLEQAKELVELSEKATCGKWKTWGMAVMAPQDGVDADNSDVCLSREVAYTYCQVDGRMRTFDADFICSARNTAPDIARDYLEKCRQLDEALKVMEKIESEALDDSHQEYIARIARDFLNRVGGVSHE